MYTLASSSAKTCTASENGLKSFVYIPQGHPSTPRVNPSPCKGGRRDHFTDFELSHVVSIPETHIAREIPPFDLSRKGNIDPSRFPSIRATNLHQVPKRSMSRPFPTRAHIEGRLKLAEELHALVSKHRPQMPGAPDTYRSLQFSESNRPFSPRNVIKASAGNISATTLEKRVSILFEKIVALRRETPRSPSLREWEQCLRGIKKCAKKLAELVSDMDPPRVLKAHRDLFDLIQIALQSGPMAGSKPGEKSSR